MKTELREYIQFVVAAIQRMDASLTPEERDAAGSYQRWNFKDTIAHLTYGAARLADRFAGIEPQEPPDFEDLNRAIYERAVDIPRESLLERMVQDYARLLAVVESLSEEDLRGDGEARFAWLEGTPPWRRLAGVAMHAVTHLTLYLQLRGRHAEALALGAEHDAAAGRLSGEPSWRAVLVYNRACLHALAGDAEAAAPLLAESFTGRPDLRELARQDTDLDLVRGHPAVQALLAA